PRDLLELFSTRTCARLNRNALQDGHQVSRDGFGFDRNREVSFVDRALNARHHRAADRLGAITDIPSDRRVRTAAAYRGDDAEAAATFAGDVVDRALEQALGHAARGGRFERRADISQLLALVEIERALEELFLVAERRVEAGPGDTHRLGEVGQRGALVTLLPEHVQGRGERFFHVEFAWTTSDGELFHIERYVMPFAAKSSR